MNKNQKAILAKIVDGKESVIVDEFFSFYLDKGLGSISKQNLDVFIFYLLDKYQDKTQNKLSNYEWSSLLKISELKIKNLRLQAGISYTSDDDNYDFDRWIDFLDLLREGYVSIEADKYVVTIENTFLLRFVEHQLKVLKLPATDYSFNREIIKFNKNSMEALVKAAGDVIGVEDTYAKKKISQAKWNDWGTKANTALVELVTKSLPAKALKILMGTG